MKEGKEKKRERLINYDTLDEQTQALFTAIFDEYDDCSIFKLREVARRMGVKSATTMDKRTLVTVMTEFRLASTVYYPPERSSVAPVTYSEVEEITNDYLMRSLVLKPEQKSGILEIAPDGAWLRVNGFAQSDRDIFVPMLMVNEKKLLSGDEITGMTRFMEKSGRFGLFKCESINRQSPNEFIRRPLPDAMPANEPIRLKKGSKTFNAIITACPFCKGQRRLIVGLDAFKPDRLAREISTSLTEAGFEALNIFLDESPEAVTDTRTLAGRTTALTCEDYAGGEAAVNLAVEYAKRAAPYGRDVALIINNAEILSEDTLRKVFGAGRFTESGSITPVIISSSLELNPVINRLSRTATGMTLLKNNFSDEPLIDIRRSFADCESLLSEIEIQTLRDCRRQLSEQFVSVKEFTAAYEILLAGNKE